jgi:alkylation response protein AidB-like acyl-CoA dehydrogenase
VFTSAIVDRYGDASLKDRLVPRFVAGATGACALGTGDLRVDVVDGSYELYGRSGPILGAPGAEILVVAAEGPEGPIIVALEAASARIEVTEHVDVTRSLGRVVVEHQRVSPDDVLTSASLDQLQDLAAVLCGAEASGLAQWCLESVLAYVKERVQFDRPVGAFQAVKHKCARLFIATEQLSAAAWDGARAVVDEPHQASVAAAEVAAMGPALATEICLEAITLFGGIGFTWEHDIHLYWRRAISLNQILGPRKEWCGRLGRLVVDGERVFHVEVADADPGFRDRVSGQLRKIRDLPSAQQRQALADAGLVSPQYPSPYGLDATPVEQLVIAEEFVRAGYQERPTTTIGEWVLPTILAHGSADQQDRFVPPTLGGQIRWCQLFSEPGAGSDLASLRTRADRVAGGWLINGQKVWTSQAHEANWGACLARTDHDVAKHAGITYLLVEMDSPGVEVRPLRQANGASEFNEVFLTDVFVPDECVVGSPGDGWRLATTTMTNERLSIGSGMGRTTAFEPVEVVRRLGRMDTMTLSDLGALCAEQYAHLALGLRSTLRRLSGFQPGFEGAVMKAAEGSLRVRAASAVLGWSGAEAATTFGHPGDPVWDYLSTPQTLIGGGTIEMQLNVIAERILQLPRR